MEKTVKNKRHIVDNIRGWFIIGPILLYYFIFGIIPLIIVINYSFYEDDLFLGKVYVGLQNYITILTDKQYQQSFLSTVIIGFFTILLSLFGGMFLAILMSGPVKGKSAYRVIYYVPVVVSMAIVAQVVNIWLNYNSGTFNNILESLGKSRVEWNKSTFWMFFWIIIICTWKGIGATIILFIAGLNAISPDVYDAADVDGVTPWIRFWKITLPLMKPMLVFVMITSIIGAFNVFEPVQLISGGGPEGTTKVILFEIYNQSFQNGNFGMGSAISVILLIVLMALTILNMKLGEEKD